MLRVTATDLQKWWASSDPAESCRQDEKSTEIFVRAGRITGLSKVYGAQGNALAAKQADEKLTKTWIGGRSLLQLWKL